MIKFEIEVPIGVAFRLSSFLEKQKCYEATTKVLEAIKAQGFPQIDQAIAALEENRQEENHG